MSAREEVLARIRAASSGAPVPPIPRDYRTRGELGRGEVLSLFAARVTDYRATVRRCTYDERSSVVAELLAAHGIRRVVVPAGFDRGLLPDGLAVLVDVPNLAIEALDGVDAAVTGAAVAIAETGTFVLDGAPDQGRRALTLVPDCHLVLIRSAQVVETVPEAIARLDPSRPLTWVSGPSATSDIELRRVEGVHGPRTLLVVLVDAE